MGTAARPVTGGIGIRSMASHPTRVFASLMLLAAIGCDGELTRPSLYNQVEITVTAGSEPVPGVHLVLYTGPRPMGFGETGADGRYTFRRVPQNAYSVFVAIPAGYDTISRGPNQLPAYVLGPFDVAGQITVEAELKLVKR